MSSFVPPPHFRVFEDIPGVDARFFTAEGGTSTGLYAAPNGSPGLNCAFGGYDSEIAKTKNRAIVARTFGVSSEQLLTTSEEKNSVKVVTGAWTTCDLPKDNAMVAAEFRGHAIGVLTCN